MPQRAVAEREDGEVAVRRDLARHEAVEHAGEPSTARARARARSRGAPKMSGMVAGCCYPAARAPRRGDALPPRTRRSEHA